MPMGLRQGKLASDWADWRRVLLDLIFPPRCVGCAARGAWLCPRCRSALPRLSPNHRLWCGIPSAPSRAGRLGDGPNPPASIPAQTALGLPLYPACRQARPALDGLHADYSFEGVLRTAIHQLKYRRARHLAAPLGELLLESLEAAAPVDALVPVPLHPSRLTERGYNQSALLAAEVARATGLPLADGPLRRVRPTEPQMALPAARRRANVAGAFAVQGRELAGLRVLLVDDVCTTGSTLQACAEALKAAGCTEVWGLTLARAR